MSMFRPHISGPVRGAVLALLATAPLAACVDQPEATTKSVLGQPAPPSRQFHQAEAAAYERGFLAGRRYQAKLDGSRPSVPCAATPAAITAAPPALTPVPATPRPTPPPANSYAPSGPAQPVTLP